MYKNEFIGHSQALRSKGKQISQLHGLAKVGGFSTAALAAIGMVSMPLSSIPLAIGLLAYAGACLSEQQRTGKLRPIPGLSDDLESLASQSLQRGRQASLGTQPHHWLRDYEKALYTLTTFHGHRLSALASTVDPETLDFLVTQFADYLASAHRAELNHPELLSAATGADYLNQAIAAMPPAVSRIAQIPAEPRAAIAPPAQQEAAQIGASTRIHAVPVESVESEPWDESPTLNVAEALASFTRSAIILGAPGSGKGYVVGAALSLLDEGVSVWLLDPKNDKTEAHYWNRVPRSQRLQFNALRRSERPDAATIIRFVESFFERNDSNALLIVDEVPALSSCMSKPEFTELMAFIAIAASSGRSRKLNAWVISQSSNVADLGINGQSRAAFMTYAMAAIEGADYPTPESWFNSFNRSMGVSPPSGVTGPYIASDCGGWYESEVPEFSALAFEPPIAGPMVVESLQKMFDAPAVDVDFEAAMPAKSNPVEDWIGSATAALLDAGIDPDYAPIIAEAMGGFSSAFSYQEIANKNAVKKVITNRTLTVRKAADALLTAGLLTGDLTSLSVCLSGSK